MVKIYGSPRSSSGRCFWLLEEIGIPYERMPLNMREREHKSEAFLKLNPNGKVPVLIDGDLILWESAAINSYLAEKHRPELLGQTLKDRALVNQWTIWAMAEFQPPFVDLLIQFLFTPPEKRDQQVIQKAQKNVLPKLEILNKQLEGKTYILGDGFTLADINIATVANISKMSQIDLSPFANVNRWLGQVCQRPAYLKVMALDH
jgi:glutathione S-transferase